MLMKNFWFISLCALLIIASFVDWVFPIRVAVAANSIVILLDVIRDARRFRNGRNKTEN